MIRFVIILLLISSTVEALNVFGTIQRVKGIAISNNMTLKINDKVYIGSDIYTKNNSKVMILQENGNIITMGKNSYLKLLKSNEVVNKKGITYFNIIHKISKNIVKHRFKIKIKSATIGIRGTNFIVSSNNNTNILLRKGNLDIISDNGKFEVYNIKLKQEYSQYSKKEKEALDSFIKDIDDGFLAYKKQNQSEFEKYSKEVNLKENTMLYFSEDKKVYKTKIDKELIKIKFNDFDNFINEKVKNTNKNNLTNKKISIPKKNIVISAIGYGPTEKDSIEDALVNLTNQISVNVKSNYKKNTKLINKTYSKDIVNTIELSSELPIKGLKYKTITENNIIKTTVTISSKNSLKSYILDIKRLYSEINTSYKKINTIKNKPVKYNLISLTISNIEQFNKMKLVATLLGAKNLPSINISLSSLKVNLLELENNIDNLDTAIKILTKDIRYKNIYVRALRVNGSKQVTQLSRVIKNKMQSYLNTVKYSNDAEYFLNGKYEILDNGIFILINILDDKNNILLSRNITISKKAYINIKYKPMNKTFDKSINNDYVKSGNLEVKIGFKGYNRVDGIDLIDGDLVDIVVKTNKEMCYFLIGHTLKNNEKFSYLLPIGNSDNTFINKITGDDVNQNITIIEEVPISSPFGSENLQIFANTLGKNGSCNLKIPNCYERNDGYCVIKGKPTTVILNTRGLNIRKKKHKIEKAEDSISFTSFKN